MTRKEYKKRAGALRKLLRELSSLGSHRRIQYTFGAVVDTETRAWQIYNYSTNNRIAIVKFHEDKVIVRYRQNSHYSGILKVFKFPLPTIAVPSLNLGRRSNWLREELRERIARSLTDSRASQSVERSAQIRNTTGLWRDQQGRLRDSRGRYASNERLAMRRRTFAQVSERLQSVPGVNDQAFYDLSHDAFLLSPTELEAGETISIPMIDSLRVPRTEQRSRPVRLENMQDDEDYSDLPF